MQERVLYGDHVLGIVLLKASVSNEENKAAHE